MSVTMCRARITQVNLVATLSRTCICGYGHGGQTTYYMMTRPIEDRDAIIPEGDERRTIGMGRTPWQLYWTSGKVTTTRRDLQRHQCGIQYLGLFPGTLPDINYSFRTALNVVVWDMGATNKVLLCHKISGENKQRVFKLSFDSSDEESGRVCTWRRSSSIRVSHRARCQRRNGSVCCWLRSVDFAWIYDGLGLLTRRSEISVWYSKVTSSEAWRIVGETVSIIARTAHLDQNRADDEGAQCLRKLLRSYTIVRDDNEDNVVKVSGTKSGDI